ATIILGNISAFLNFWIAFAAHFESSHVMLLAGVIAAALLTGDCMWYSVGRFLGSTRIGPWIKRRLSKGHAKVEEAIQKKGKRLLYLSKFAYGSGSFIVFSLGWMKMDFRTFLRNS